MLIQLYNFVPVHGTAEMSYVPVWVHMTFLEHISRKDFIINIKLRSEQYNLATSLRELSSYLAGYDGSYLYPGTDSSYETYWKDCICNCSSATGLGNHEATVVTKAEPSILPQEYQTSELEGAKGKHGKICKDMYPNDIWNHQVLYFNKVTVINEVYGASQSLRVCYEALPSCWCH